MILVDERHSLLATTGVLATLQRVTHTGLYNKDLSLREPYGHAFHNAFSFAK
jgi:hypothetical protein